MSILAYRQSLSVQTWGRVGRYIIIPHPFWAITGAHTKPRHRQVLSQHQMLPMQFSKNSADAFNAIISGQDF